MQLCVINLVSLFVYNNLHLIQAVETLVKSENHLDCNNGTLLSQNICLPSGYLEGEVPEKPTIVTTRIEINNIREVNDKKMRITLDFYQELLWVDNRIKTNLEVDEVSVLNSKMINRLWKPDLWIKNLFDFKLHGLLEPTSGLLIAMKEYCNNLSCTSNEANKNLIVTYNMEAQASIYCNFHFVNYPMDTQHCEFVMDGSYPYPNILELSLELGLFGETNHHSNTDDFVIEVTFDYKGNRSGINSNIKLERRILPFIIRYYLPCFAIVMVSFIGFIISMDSIPARVALLVTQFLTQTNILIAQQAESPSSGRFTALGFYLLTSIFFVVIGMIQFAFILHLYHLNEKNLLHTRRNGVKCSIEEKSFKITKAKEKHIFDVRRIDNIALNVVTSSFLIFNILYWIIFLSYDFNPSLNDK